MRPDWLSQIDYHSNRKDVGQGWLRAVYLSKHQLCEWWDCIRCFVLLDDEAIFSRARAAILVMQLASAARIFLGL
jgi:hypothetical protein